MGSSSSKYDILIILHENYVNKRNIIKQALDHLEIEDIKLLIMQYCECSQEAITPEEARNFKIYDTLFKKHIPLWDGFSKYNGALDTDPHFYDKYIVAMLLCVSPDTILTFKNNQEGVKKIVWPKFEKGAGIETLRIVSNLLNEPIILHQSQTYWKHSNGTTTIITPNNFVEGDVKIYLDFDRTYNLLNKDAIMKIPPKLMRYNYPVSGKMMQNFRYLKLTDLDKHYFKNDPKLTRNKIVLCRDSRYLECFKYKNSNGYLYEINDHERSNY